MSGSNCCFLTCIQVSQEAGQVVWYSHIFKNFPHLLWSTQSRLNVVSEAEVDVLEFSHFFWGSKCWQFNLWSSAFSKSSLNIWKFSVHILLKPSLENFEHYFARLWNECNCAVLWTFFGIAFLWIGMKTDLYQSCGHCWVFQICWNIKCCTFTASSFRIWNSSTGIPSPALALFIEMLSKAHLTSHSRL